MHHLRVVTDCRFRLLFVSLLLLTSCGGGGSSMTPVSPTASGLVAHGASERVAGMPGLPFSVAQTSGPFQRLYEGVREALEDEMPEPTVSSEPAYRRWIEHDLAEWLERRGTAIRAAENRARSLASATEGEKAIGHALVAYLNERTAEDVIEAPVPNEAARPDRAAALHDAWRERMAAILATAHLHWLVCARTLELPSPELGPWKAHCDDEADDGRPTGSADDESIEPDTDDEATPGDP